MLDGDRRAELGEGRIQVIPEGAAVDTGNGAIVNTVGGVSGSARPPLCCSWRASADASPTLRS